MRRKRNGSGRDVLIDLTSLLDVMFIILLVVLWGQTSTEGKLEQSRVENEYAKAKTEAEYRLYEQQMQIADSINQYVWAVSVVVPYNEYDVTQRTIRILKEGEEIESFELVGNNVTASVEAFKQSLIGYIEKNADRPVILSLNEKDETILYRDETMVSELFMELAKEYANVYIKGSISEEEK